jgi:hypothetical protein
MKTLGVLDVSEKAIGVLDLSEKANWGTTHMSHISISTAFVPNKPDSTKHELNVFAQVLKLVACGAGEWGGAINPRRCECADRGWARSKDMI